MPRSYQISAPSSAGMNHNPMQTMAFDPTNIIDAAAQYEPAAILAKEFTVQGIIDSFLVDLEAVTGINLTAVITDVNDFLDGNWPALLTALFGSTSPPTDISKILQSSIAGLEDLWNWLFGSPTPTPGVSTLSQEVITGLTDLWDWLFGTTTPVNPTINWGKITGVVEKIPTGAVGRGALSAVVKSNKFRVPAAASGHGTLVGTVNFVKEEPTLYGQAPDLFGYGRLSATARVGQFTVTASLTGQGVLRPQVPETLTIFPTTSTTYGLYPALSGRGRLTFTAVAKQFTVSAVLSGRGVLAPSIPDTTILFPTTDVLYALYPDAMGHGALTAAARATNPTGRLTGHGSLTAVVPDYVTASFIVGIQEYVYTEFFGRGVLTAAARATNPAGRLAGHGVLTAIVPSYVTASFVLGLQETVTPTVAGRGVLVATAISKKFTVSAALTGLGVLRPQVPETLVFFPSTGTVYTPTLYTTLFGHGVLSATAVSKKFTLTGAATGHGVLTGLAYGVFITAGIQTDTVYPELVGRGVAAAAARATNPAGRLAGRGVLTGLVPELTTVSFVLGIKEALVLTLYGAGKLTATAVVKQFSITGAVLGHGALTAKVPDITTSSFVNGQKFGISSFTAGHGVLSATANSTRAVIAAALSGHGALTSRSGGPSIGGLEQALINALWDALTGNLTGTVAQLQAAFNDLMTLLGVPTGLGTGSPVASGPATTPLLGTLVPATNTTVANDIFGGSTFWSSLMSLLFPTSGGSVGAAVTATAVTNVLGGSNLGADLTTLATQLFGAPVVNAITTAEQDIATFLSNAISGGNAPTASSMLGVTSPVAYLEGLLGAIPHTNVVIPPSPGTGTITWDANASATPYTGAVNNFVTRTWNHTCAAATPTVPAANYLIVRLAFYAPSATVVAVTYSGLSMQLLQTVTDAAPARTVQIYGMPNPPTGFAQQVSVTVYAPFGNYIQLVAAESDSYFDVGSVDSTATNTGVNSSPSLTVPSATGDYIAQAFYVGSQSLLETLTPTAPVGEVTQYNSGGLVGSTESAAFVASDAAGGASVSFTATASNPSTARWVAAAVSLTPLPSMVLGSTFRAANTSTGTVSASSGSTLFVNGFFNTQTSGLTSNDLTYAATSFCKVTVEHAGTYSVTISVLLVSTFANQFIGLNLVQNGTITKRGHTSWIGGFSTNTVCAHTFQVYCSAGDTLQPGYYSSTSGAAFTGTADGLSTYFEVSLNNRGLHS